MTFRIGGLEAHPTKGYRGFARPRRKYGRRKLIHQGRCLVPLAHDSQVEDLRWSPVRRERAAWRKAHTKTVS